MGSNSYQLASCQGSVSEVNRKVGWQRLHSFKRTQHLQMLSFILLIVLIFGSRLILCHPGWPRTCTRAQGGLELKAIVLLQPSEYWSYRIIKLLVSLFVFLFVLFFKRGFPCVAQAVLELTL